MKENKVDYTVDFDAYATRVLTTYVGSPERTQVLNDFEAQVEAEYYAENPRWKGWIPVYVIIISAFVLSPLALIFLD